VLIVVFVFVSHFAIQPSSRQFFAARTVFKQQLKHRQHLSSSIISNQKENNKLDKTRQERNILFFLYTRSAAKDL
jgi:hypothetical protein